MGKYDYYTHNVKKDKPRYVNMRSRAPRTIVALIVLLVLIVLIVLLDRLGLVRIPFITRILDGIASGISNLFGGGG